MTADQPETADQERRKRIAWVLAPGLIAFSMGQTVLFALAGPVFRDIGMSEQQLGWIISAAAVMFVIASPIWGKISDRWGRKKSIVFGLITYGIISLLFAGVMQLGLDGTMTAATVFVVLLVLRLLYASFGSGIQPSSVALMADHSSEEQRSSAVAIVGAAFGLGMVLGPAAAPLLVSFGILAPLYVIAVLGLITAGLAMWGLPKDAPAKTESQSGSSKTSLKTLAPLLFGGFAIYTSMATIQQTYAFNVQDLLQVTSADTIRLTGYCFMVLAIATLLVQGGVIQVFKPRAQVLLYTGLPTILAGLVVYLFASQFWHLIIASLVMGAGFGLTTPGFMSANSLMSSDDEQGRTAGWMQATMSAGFIVGPLAGTTVYGIARELAPVIAISATTLGLVTIGTWLFFQRATLANVTSTEARTNSESS
ncbi:MAG: MFS transporter [Pseudomonadota bacterium]